MVEVIAYGLLILGVLIFGIVVDFLWNALMGLDSITGDPKDR